MKTMKLKQDEPTPAPWRMNWGNDVILGPRGEVLFRFQRIADARLAVAAPKMFDILMRILRAHDSGNNGAYMGEAVLCPLFAETARAILAEAKKEDR
jgi:hypothetical protein